MKPRERKRAKLVKKMPSTNQATRTARGARKWLPAGLGALVVVAAVLCIFYWARRPAARPVAGNGLNVVLITVDTTRADYLGCYGRSGGRTPNMDGLARDGALFERCISSAPMTTPSHGSILTGNYPYVHGARRNSGSALADGNVTLAEVLRDSGYQTAATVASFVLNREWGFGQGFDEFHDVSKIAVEDPQQAERKGDEVSADACALLRKLSPAPFFLWVHFYDPHFPYETKRTPPYTPAEAYEDEVAFMDEQIGQVLSELRKLNLDQRTLVVLVGDHGEGLGDHGESQHAYLLYNSTIHVPLAMRCPGVIAAGSSVADLVRTIDIPPTVISLLGLPPMEHIQGVSLVDRLGGKGPQTPLEAYSEAVEAHAQFGVSRLRCLVDGEWKFILAPKPELYRTLDDPGEKSSLAAQNPELASQMRQRLRTLIAESPPPATGGSTPSLNDADRARLESLGYAGSGVTQEDSGQNELERFEPEGGNPLDFVPQFELTVQARDVMQQRDYARAVQMFQQVLAVLPNASRPAGLLGSALVAQGRPQDAIPVFERALALVPEDTYLRSSYGSALMQVGRFQEAADQFRAVLRENAQNARVLHNMAIALIQLGRLGDADKHLQIALRLEPENPRIYHTLGILRMRESRYPEAQQYLVKALELDPGFRQCEEDLRKLRASVPSLKP